MFGWAMTHTLVGGLLVPVLFSVGLGFALWRSRSGRQRRVADIAPGRLVIATNLVSSRRRAR
jgi:hypothetical protein